MSNKLSFSLDPGIKLIAGKRGGVRKERPLPSLGRRLVNVSKAAVATVKGMIDEDVNPFVDADTFNARLPVCLDCAWYRETDGKCAHPDCGCPVKRKIRLKISRCPMGKWNAVEGVKG